MAIFGWIVSVIFALWFTFVSDFSLLFGGLDLGPAKKQWWLLYVPLVALVWWFVISLAPFEVWPMADKTKTYIIEWHTFGYHSEERQAESEHEVRAAIESECPERLPVHITEKERDDEC